MTSDSKTPVSEQAAATLFTKEGFWCCGLAFFSDFLPKIF
jgi:hypothetical protein